MKKVKRRSTVTLLIAILLVCGLSLYFVRLADNGGTWATYFSTDSPIGVLTDRDGVVLYSSDGGEASYAEDYTTRLSCYHIVGDTSGKVGTGVVLNFRDELSDYSILTGETTANTITLTVDADLQTAAYNALAGRNGSVLVMDYTTGEVLCMVSTPADDPANPSDSPADGTYLNKCISSTFVPGSIFKLVTLCAAIENIPDLYDRQFYCDGSDIIENSYLTCSGIHGYQNIEQALSNSCNCTFGPLALELGGDTMTKYVADLGLTSEHSLDGIVTAAGSFTQGDEGSIGLAWSGIGQYEDLISPFAMLRYVASIANGGSVVEPTMFGYDDLSEHTTQLISSDTAQKIALMMDYNVQNAYGTWNFPGLAICAKTGTAEVGDGTSHSWFTGFLNDAEHPYAFIVLVEHGGGGLSNAGAIANAVLQAAVAG